MATPLPCAATSHMSLEVFNRIRERIPDLEVEAGCEPGQ